MQKEARRVIGAANPHRNTAVRCLSAANCLSGLCSTLNCALVACLFLRRSAVQTGHRSGGRSSGPGGRRAGGCPLLSAGYIGFASAADAVPVELWVARLMVHKSTDCCAVAAFHGYPKPPAFDCRNSDHSHTLQGFRPAHQDLPESASTTRQIVYHLNRTYHVLPT